MRFSPLTFQTQSINKVLGCIVFVVWGAINTLAARQIVPFQHNRELSQQTIRSIQVDADGYLWLGTYDGLNRFDGIQVRTFETAPNDPTSIDSNNVRDMLVDETGQFWALSELSLNAYHPQTETFQRYPPLAKTSTWHTRFSCVIQDGNGTIWVGSTNGLFRLDPDQKGLVLASSFSNSDILSLSKSKTGGLWVGTEAGLYLFDPQTGKSILQPFSNDYKCHCVLELGDHTLLMGSQKGLLLFEGSTNEPKLFMHSDSDLTTLSQTKVTNLFRSQEGEIWVGTEYGLNLMNLEKGTFRRFSTTGPSNGTYNDEIDSFYQSQPGLIWVGTHNGLKVIDSITHKFETYHLKDMTQGESDDYIRGFFEDEEGHIWIGHRNGIAIWNRQNNQVKSLAHKSNDPASLPEGTVWSFLLDSENQLWVAADGGLLRWIRGTDHFENILTKNESRPNPNPFRIYCMEEMAPGHLITGTRDQGIVLVDTQNEKIEHIPPQPDNLKGLSDAFVRCILKDTKGRIWVGTHRGVLQQYNPQTKEFKRFNLHSEDGPSSTIYCLVEDDQGAFWAGRGNGLQKLNFDGEEFSQKTYDTKDGLANNSTYGVVIAPNGKIWVSTNRGLSEFDPITESFKNYTQEDGLQANEFNLHSYFLTRDEKLLFGGVNGFNIIDPENIHKNPFPPPVVFTNFQINNQTVRMSKEGVPLLDQVTGQILRNGSHLILNHNHRVISFQFSALNYAGSRKNQYAYQLQGFDDDWVMAGTRNTATYTNLKPGDYEFRVKGSNNDGIWSPHPLTVQMKVLPPFWLSWWFRTLAVLIFGLVLFAIHRIRTRILAKHNQELKVEIQSRIETEKNLKRSERKFSLAFHFSPDGVLLFRQDDGILLEANLGFSKICGREEKLPGNQSFYDLNLFQNQAQKEDLQKRIEKGRLKTWEGTLTDSSGQERIVHVSGESLRYENMDCFLMIVRDLTDAHRLEEQLAQSQKMESIGLLAGGIAHDFNNLLTVISGYSELGMRLGTQSDKIEKILKDINKASQKAQRLTSQILAFSRKQKSKPRNLEINGVIKDMSSIFRRLLAEDIKLEFEYASESIHIYADPSQVEQVLMNLIVNAQDAFRNKKSSDPRVITISTEKTFIDPDTTPVDPNIGRGDHLLLSIQDNGCGMDRQVRSRVFEPFFTTKEKGKGTGLGLSMVYGIVKQNGATIHLYSELEIGTRFTIYWPIIENLEDSPAEVSSGDLIEGGNETLLLVEDNPGVLEYMQLSLAHLGYKIETALNGKEAFSKIEEGLIPDLIITDLIMPEMNGAELAKALSESGKDHLPILFLSGYTDSYLRQTGVLSPGVNFLQKPFSSRVLAQKIRATFEGKNT